MIKTMKPGSVIVDLAAEQGGNTPLTKADEVIEVHGVTIMGYTNLPGALAVDASSRSMRATCSISSALFVDKKTGALALNWDDEIVKGAGVTRDGEIVHPALKEIELMEAIDPFVFRLSIFVLAIFVGYFVVWGVTPALHTPLMSVTNAISSVIVVGALIAVSVPAIGARILDFQGAGLRRADPGLGEHLRRLPGHPAHAGDVQEEREEVRKRKGTDDERERRYRRPALSRRRRRCSSWRCGACRRRRPVAHGQPQRHDRHGASPSLTTLWVAGVTDPLTWA